MVGNKNLYIFYSSTIQTDGDLLEALLQLIGLSLEIPMIPIKKVSILLYLYCYAVFGAASNNNIFVLKTKIHL
jgi:hypothetical protein